MAVIAPESKLRVLKGIPFDRGYAHTLYFASESAQRSYMTGKVDREFTDFTYIRTYENRVRVQAHPDTMYDCNYIMFQNTNFGNKWFYAFIVELNYINNECTEIVFDIDVIQTWWFEFKFGDCYVERRHVADDTVFNHTADEGLGTGEYIVETADTFLMGEMNICIIAGQGRKGGHPVPIVTNHIYNPLVGYTASEFDVASINSILSDYQESGGTDSIVSVFEYPSWLGKFEQPSVKSETFVSLPNLSTIDGYSPRHNKLFCYPYHFMVLSNNTGQTSVLKYELFDDPTRPTFEVKGTFLPMPSIICYPLNYRGRRRDYESGLLMNSFPQCPIVTDGYKQYVALHRSDMINMGIAGTVGDLMGVIGGVASMAGSATSGNIGGVISSGSSSLGSVINLAGGREIALHDLERIPNSVHGQGGSDSLNVAIGGDKCAFTVMETSIRKEMARKLDEYFDVYGYKAMRVQKPNFDSRPNHNYIRCNGAIVFGNAPSEAKERMAQILNNGCIFFQKESTYGNVTVDN